MYGKSKRNRARVWGFIPTPTYSNTRKLKLMWGFIPTPTYSNTRKLKLMWGFIPTPTYSNTRKLKLMWGFTLIELLLAVSIFSIVASVIYSSFRLGVDSWRRTEANLSRYQRIRYAINRLSEDIANAFFYKNIPFKGEEERIEFASFIKSKDAKESTIGKICYFFSHPETTGGSSEELIRQKIPYQQAVKETEGEAAASLKEPSSGEELLSDVLGFSLNYCYKMPDEDVDSIEWLPDWISEEAIPEGVKVELVIKDDYAPGGRRTFTKRIHIPVGEIGNLGELEE